jgi:hypothetical protein
MSRARRLSPLRGGVRCGAEMPRGVDARSTPGLTLRQIRVLFCLQGSRRPLFAMVLARVDPRGGRALLLSASRNADP